MHGMIPQWTLSDRLRKAREVTHMDQVAFAEHIGISRQSVSAAESGRSTPRELTIRAWAMATGVSLDWLRDGETPPPVGDGVRSYTPSDSNREPAGYGNIARLHGTPIERKRGHAA